MSALKEWHRFVAGFGCCVCWGSAQIHHPRGGSVAGEAGAGKKSSESGVIPLCERHHTGEEGIHQIGVKTWEARYGTQALHRQRLMNRIREWERQTGRAAPRAPVEPDSILAKVLPRWGAE